MRFARADSGRRVISLIVAIYALVTIRSAFGDQSATSQDLPIPRVEAFSGSPLLLEITLDDPERRVSVVRVESEISTQEYRLLPEVDREPLILRVSPFLQSGVYDLEVTVVADDGREARNMLSLGFVDFVWGRDNMSFGNNTQYESVVGTFGEALADWVAERFGEVDEPDMVLLVDYMYSLFGRNTGRCYAFAGTEVRYWLWPELLPPYRRSAHDLRADRPQNQRNMNFLQFDIVFDHFVAGPGAEQISTAMSRDQIEQQGREIIERIAMNQPVAVGFAGPDLHHSMLVFGFISDPGNQTLDLLVANNWKSDEKLNIHSRDAEIIRLFLSDENRSARVEWHYEDGLRDRDIDRVFMVEVQRRYSHDHALFDALVEHLRTDFFETGVARIVVEEAYGARLTNGELASGQIGRRRSNDLTGVWYERVSRAYRFAYPVDDTLQLEITDDTGARILAVYPGPDANSPSALLLTTDTPPDGERITRFIELDSHNPGIFAGTR